MNRYFFSTFLCIVLVGSNGFAQEDMTSLKKGKVLSQSNEHGEYFVYIPKRQPERVLDVVHGMPGDNEKTIDLADKFIQRWVPFAKKHRLILISPSFNRENFGASGYGYGGFRGLFGRKVGGGRTHAELTASCAMFRTASLKTLWDRLLAEKVKTTKRFRENAKSATWLAANDFAT
jgi:hypothetical protein